MSKTKNLGQVSGVFIGKSAPNNTSIIWYDDTPNQMCHKVYDPITNSWKALSPDIVSNTTYSELVINAKKNGLSVGKHYVITDKSNTLAIAVTSTKVQYIDSLGNILVDDLGTNIQYHVSSSNLLIDDISGVFDIDSNKLVFRFQEQENIDINEDYFFGKVRYNAKWILSKFRFSSLVSKETDNSLFWKNGLYFSLKVSIAKILNKDGGIVGYDDYIKKINQIDTSVTNVSKNNQEIIENANKKINEKTKDSVIFSKKINDSIDVSIEPGDIIRGDSLFSIVSKFQRWINRFKYATGIRISKSFADAKSHQYINNNDTVESAFAKIQYILKNPTTSGELPSNWGTGALLDDGTYDKTGEYTAFTEDGYPVAGDSIFYAFSKIVDFIMKSGKNVRLSSDWREIDYFNVVNYPIANDSVDVAFQKLTAKFKQIGEITNGSIKTDKMVLNTTDGFLEFSNPDSYFNLKNEQSSLEMNSNGIKLKSYNTPIDRSETGSMDAAVLFRTGGSDELEQRSCALTAVNTGNPKYSVDAFFKRLSFDMTISSPTLTSADTYYANDGFIGVISDGVQKHVYLPQEPMVGTTILIYAVNTGTKSIAVHSQGSDVIYYFDKINISINNGILTSSQVPIMEKVGIVRFIYTAYGTWRAFGCGYFNIYGQ